MVVLGGGRFLMSEVPLHLTVWNAVASWNVGLDGVVSVRPAGQGSQFKNNYYTEMCSGSEEGSYLRLIDFCITQL